MNPCTRGSHSGSRSTLQLASDPLLALEFSRRSAARLLPEVSLMAAVLEDAVHCLRKNVNAKRGRARIEFLEAWRWISDAERSWPFAFENVCDTLGLSPGAVRRTIGRSLIGGNGSGGEKAAA